ncbi:MAG: M14 family zinc carboxypeptidase [Bacillota bacterium]
MKRKPFYCVTVMIMIACIMFTPTAFAEKTIPNGPSTNGNDTISSIVTYEDMIKILGDIEHTSKGKVNVFTLDEYGTTEKGRSIYAATIGSGETKVWVQAQIHGDEKLVTEAALQLLKNLSKSKSADVETILQELTIYVIPMYNPDGSIANTRGNINGIDLNRDWTLDGFKGAESLVVYKYWADVKPDYAIDLHHQGFKTVAGTNESTSFSLGISLAPDGPTLPGIKDGSYNTVTKQMVSYVYEDLKDYGYTHIDRYQVGGEEKYFIDIKGGVVSAMMLGLNYDGINPTEHSNPAIFFETKGNSRDNSLGQKSNGYLTKQNYLGLKSILYGLASGEVFTVDEGRWYDIPAYDAVGYLTDY